MLRPWLRDFLCLDASFSGPHLVPGRLTFPAVDLQFKFTGPGPDLHLLPPVERIALGKARVGESNRSENAVRVFRWFGNIDHSSPNHVKRVSPIIPEAFVQRE